MTWSLKKYSCPVVTGKRALEYFCYHLLKRKKGDKSGDNVGYTVLLKYVNALIDLCKNQKRIELENAKVVPEIPRTEGVKELLKLTSSKEQERKRTCYEERGVGTITDGWNLKEYKKISLYCGDRRAELEGAPEDEKRK